MKVAVFAQNRDFFGAKIVHIPLLYSIKKRLEPCEIDVYTSYINNYFFIETGLVKNVFYYTSFKDVCRYLKQMDYDILFSLRPECEWLNFILAFSRIKAKIGFKHWFSSLSYTHSIVYSKKIYRALEFNSLIPNSLALDSYFNCFEEKRLSDKKTIFLIPAGGSDFKRWDIDNFITLAKCLGNKYFFCFVLGEKERDYLALIESSMCGFEFQILYMVSWKELVCYFKSGYIFISNDCGPFHIAQLLKKPAVAIYSDFLADADEVIKEWFYSHHLSTAIKGERDKSINSVSVEKVLFEVERIISLLEKS